MGSFYLSIMRLFHFLPYFLAILLVIILFSPIHSVNASSNIPFNNSFGTFISEIMYNPAGSDNNREYVEIYSTKIFNFSNFIIADSSSNDTLRQLFYVPDSSYSLIVEDGFNYSGINASIYGVGNTIGNDLNDEENLSLYFPNNTRIDFVHYTSDQGAKNNNYSLERRQDSSWGESRTLGGTPGNKNSIWNTTQHLLDLEISEFLPNTFNGDEELKPNGEWIELHNIGSTEIYLGGLLFEDQSGHKLYVDNTKIMGDSNGLYLKPGKYIVIYRDGDSDFSMNDYGYEEISLIYNNQTIDLVSYSDTQEGMSWSKVDDNWYQALPTPEEGNKVTGDCDWLLLLDLNNSIYQPERFAFEISAMRVFGNTPNITVRGKIENSNGEIIETYSPWSNASITSISTKRYSPNLKEGLYQIIFWIDNLTCYEVDPVDNQVSRAIAINPTYQKTTSTIEITSITAGSKNTTKWGDQLRVKVNIYKGDTTKEVVEAYAQKGGETISERTKLNVEDDYKSYPLTIPIQLFPNCNNDISDGKAVLVVQGLDARTEREFEVGGVNEDVCKDYLDYIDQIEEEATKLQYHISESQAIVSPGEVFPVTVHFQNEEKPHKFTLWSYVYRGRKCYSCDESTQDRNANEQTITLVSAESNDVELFVKLDPKMDDGEYNLKVEVQKDQQKTSHALIKTIYVKNMKQNVSQLLEVSAGDKAETEGDLITSDFMVRSRVSNESKGVVVYESNAQRSKKLIPTFLAVSLALLCLVVVWKQK